MGAATWFWLDFGVNWEFDLVLEQARQLGWRLLAMFCAVWTESLPLHLPVSSLIFPWPYSLNARRKKLGVAGLVVDF